MSRRRKLTDTTPFDTIKLEGTLFVPELLERAASGEATAQKETDYAIPRGLKLHDEYGRAFRIATASWQAFAPQIARTDLDPAKLTTAFVLDLLRDCLAYTDLTLCPSPVTATGEGSAKSESGPSSFNLHPSSFRSFPITAQALGGRLPIIIAPHNLALDDPDPRFAILGSGTRRKSAHQLAQEFLNASRDCLWAIVTNGKTLRLLRDADTLTRPNFLEFDLETILRDEQQRYADFAALWRILHATRAGAATAAPTDCIWEKWKSEGHAQGLRIRDGLRDGVQEALLILGKGFITQPDNTALRQRLQDGTLTKEEYFQQLLRLIYRCLFLFCAEERDLLHTPAPTSDPSVPSDLSVLSNHAAARQAYATGYSLRRLRNRSLRQTAHDSHADLWLSLRITFRGLASGQPRLALPALGGLFAETQCPDLDSAALTNRDLLSAMRHLRWFFDKKSGQRGAIDYRNMGPEELGSVYESLLELVPQLDLPARTFGFAGITDTASTSGNARKTTGSYYTPDSLVQELIKSALDPVIADRLAAQPDRPVEALLSITVCDPSCGSGHFLLAAARRLAEKLAELRAPDGAVRPDDYRHALREVASRCLYGVDINPMAVELCRVALWLETVDPGKPLGFLNHHIRTGNSLLGTTPDLIAAGLPDDTFTAIEGDDKPACAELKKRNKKEREGFGPLFEKEEQTIRDRLRHAATQIEAMDDSQPAALQQKEAAFTTSETAPEYRHAKLLADLWCAAFVIKKTYPASEEVESPISDPASQIAQPIEGHLLHTQDELFGQPTPAPAPPPTKKAKEPKTKNQEPGTASGITTAHLRDFVQGKPLPADLQTEVDALARQYRFFHWHLAFPQVFDQGGFVCILGNPPWDTVQNRDVGSNQKSADSRAVTAEQHLLSSSGLFPFTGDGRKNLYALFTEKSLQIKSPTGVAGLVVPTGLAQDDPAEQLLAFLLKNNLLRSIYDFENRGVWFSEVHRQYRICLAVIGSAIDGKASFVFDCESVSDIHDESRVVRLGFDDVQTLCTGSIKIPMLRSAEEAAIVSRLHQRGVMIGRLEQGKAIASGLMFNFGPKEKAVKIDMPSNGILPEGYSRVFEGDLMNQFSHRFATYVGDERFKFDEAQLRDPETIVLTASLLPTEFVEERIRQMAGHTPNGIVALRRHARGGDSYVAISSIIPKASSEASLSVFFPKDGSSKFSLYLCANFNSFVFNYLLARRLSGPSSNKGTYWQIPVVTDYLTGQKHCPLPGEFIADRVLELTYTAWDLEAFAADCGWSGPPFRWDEERRFLLRCELDAAFFHLYLGPQSEWQQQPEALTRAFPTPRHAVSYIMDTFPIVKRKDEAKHGHYRTKETILQIYDALGKAMESGIPYQTLLTPPPADPDCCHPTREETSPIAHKHWQDSSFTLLAPVRKKVHNYSLAVWPELIRQWDKDLDFETFRKAYWLLCEPDQFEQEGKKLLPDLPAAWWRSRRETLEAKGFIPSLKGSATIGDLKVWRKEGGRHIRWTGSLPDGLVHEAVDDARVALQIASQLTDNAAPEAEEMAEIELLLQTLETA